MAKSRTHAHATQEAKVFDLSTRYMAESLDIPILDPETNEPTGMTWTVGSQFSKAARAAAMAATRLRLNAKGEVEADAVTDFDDTLLDQLVAVTLRWSGFKVEGAELPCTPENVRALLTDERTAWMRPQVQTGYLTLSRFFTKANAR
jgi:hypothetical protein